MNKIAVVYWSGTGNTEKMAAKVAEGAKAAGAQVAVIQLLNFRLTILMNMMQLLSDARPWDRSSLKKASSSLCLKSAKPN